MASWAGNNDFTAIKMAAKMISLSQKYVARIDDSFSSFVIYIYK